MTFVGFRDRALNPFGGEPGAFGLGAVVSPAPFLAELAKRGVKAAAFEGAAVT